MILFIYRRKNTARCTYVDLSSLRSIVRGHLLLLSYLTASIHTLQATADSGFVV